MRRAGNGGAARSLNLGPVIWRWFKPEKNREDFLRDSRKTWNYGELFFRFKNKVNGLKQLLLAHERGRRTLTTIQI